MPEDDKSLGGLARIHAEILQLPTSELVELCEWLLKVISARRAINKSRGQAAPSEPHKAQADVGASQPSPITAIATPQTAAAGAGTPTGASRGRSRSRSRLNGVETTPPTVALTSTAPSSHSTKVARECAIGTGAGDGDIGKLPLSGTAVSGGCRDVQPPSPPPPPPPPPPAPLAQPESQPVWTDGSYQRLSQTDLADLLALRSALNCANKEFAERSQVAGSARAKLDHAREVERACRANLDISAPEAAARQADEVAAQADLAAKQNVWHTHEEQDMAAHRVSAAGIASRSAVMEAAMFQTCHLQAEAESSEAGRTSIDANAALQWAERELVEVSDAMKSFVACRVRDGILTAEEGHHWIAPVGQLTTASAAQAKLDGMVTQEVCITKSQLAGAATRAKERRAAAAERASAAAELAAAKARALRAAETVQAVYCRPTS